MWGKEGMREEVGYWDATSENKISLSYKTDVFVT